MLTNLLAQSITIYAPDFFALSVCPQRISRPLLTRKMQFGDQGAEREALRNGNLRCCQVRVVHHLRFLPRRRYWPQTCFKHWYRSSGRLDDLHCLFLDGGPWHR